MDKQNEEFKKDFYKNHGDYVVAIMNSDGFINSLWQMN